MTEKEAGPESSGIRSYWTHPAVVVGTVGVLVLMATALVVLAIRGHGDRTDQATAGSTTSATSTVAATPTPSGSSRAVSNNSATETPTHQGSVTSSNGGTTGGNTGGGSGNTTRTSSPSPTSRDEGGDATPADLTAWDSYTGNTGTIVISNSGTVAVSGWTITLTYGDASHSIGGASGAIVAQPSKKVFTLTPTSATNTVNGDSSVTITFQVDGNSKQPTCTIDGRACG